MSYTASRASSRDQWFKCGETDPAMVTGLEPVDNLPKDKARKPRLQSAPANRILTNRSLNTVFSCLQNPLRVL
eukprot:9283925-Pyramimonas_sp.AAC.1